MKEEILPYLSNIRKIVSDYLLPVFCSRIDDQIKFMKSGEQVIKNYAKRLQTSSIEKDLYKLRLGYHNDLYSVIQTKYSEPEKNNFDNHFSLFIENINSLLLTIENDIIKVQDEERFIINKTDGFLLKILKRLKNLFFFISKIPLETGNIFRKLFKKPIKTRQRWGHKIPLRNLTTFFLRDLFSSSVIEIIKEMNKNISRTSLSVWKTDEETGDKFGEKVPVVDFSESILELENLKTELVRLIEKAKQVNWDVLLLNI